ncbi:putative DNA-binding transcriptional regulator YafY [Cerasibacillus quisquiliarum]|uniref:WYL domain-containing protein n=1 Tax=Cerasibacillus quisquiliarum TaxID=227865 RepID=A0A511V358_9BACI|nr:WYL domain-containing protein [Cerasibacillus quisquiliarum]MBB5146048.1 putative DNA-binding transcriptional regulator YafY [Cerasibacillus quisquiliarum]GEN32173.1 WYL domain-containing protein [Cerasibacillus quisquiliarum]
MKTGNSYRLLKLKDILFSETDKNHELTIKEINERLQAVMDENFDVRTIKRDMEVLENMGFEIIQNKGKYGKLYYSHQSRLFETYQLRLLNDAILSARFITSKEKKRLIEKIKKLTSRHIAKTLPSPLLFSPSSNIDYELVKINIDLVHRAIHNKHVITYQYGKYNVNKEFTYNRNGDRYEVEPYALIWQNDYYYLIGRFIKEDEIRHYRLDRIRNIELSEKRFRKRDFDLGSYVNQSFHMFAGKDTWLKVQFKNDLINAILDRFGHDARIRPIDDEHFMLTTKVKLSDGLISWLLAWGDQAKVLSPDHVIEALKEKIGRMKKIYD